MGSPGLESPAPTETGKSWRKDGLAVRGGMSSCPDSPGGRLDAGQTLPPAPHAAPAPPAGYAVLQGRVHPQSPRHSCPAGSHCLEGSFHPGFLALPSRCFDFCAEKFPEAKKQRGVVIC